MLKTQREYFDTRNVEKLRAAKRWEKRLRDKCEAIAVREGRRVMSSVALHEPELADLERPAPPPKYRSCAFCGRPASAVCDRAGCGATVCDVHRVIASTAVLQRPAGAVFDTVDYCPSHSNGEGS